MCLYKGALYLYLYLYYYLLNANLKFNLEIKEKLYNFLTVE